jgi:hypothetical protein
LESSSQLWFSPPVPSLRASSPLAFSRPSPLLMKRSKRKREKREIFLTGIERKRICIVLWFGFGFGIVYIGMVGVRWLDELWSARIDDVDASFWRDFFNLEYRVFRKFLAGLFELFFCVLRG